MNLVLLLSIILVTQLPLYTFGKSLARVTASTDVAVNEIDSHKETPSIGAESDDELRVRRNSLADDDDDDLLINQLSREYVTSNLLGSTATSCNK